MERASRFITFRAPGTVIESVKVLIGDGGVRIVDGFGGWVAQERPRRTARTVWEGYQPLTLEIPVLFRTLRVNDWDDGKRIEADCIMLGMMAGRGEPSPEPQQKNNKVITYTIKKTDTYAKIANSKKVDLADLLQLNNIKDPSKIKRGNKLRLPKDTERQPFGQPPVLELSADGSLIPYNDLSWSEEGLERRQWVIQDIAWEPGRRNIWGDRIRQAATVTVLQYVAPALVVTKPAPWRRNSKHRRGTKK